MVLPNLKDVGDFIAVVEAGGLSRRRPGQVIKRVVALRCGASAGDCAGHTTAESDDSKREPPDAGTRLLERVKPALSEIESAFISKPTRADPLASCGSMCQCLWQDTSFPKLPADF